MKKKAVRFEQDPYADAAEKFNTPLDSVEKSNNADDYKPLVVMGEIKENIFSVISPALPQINVLPFPVARHRSHGPHWVPLSMESEKEEEEDVEENDNSESVIAGRTSAKPLQRKEIKGGLNLEQWKELLESQKTSTANTQNGNTGGRQVVTEKLPQSVDDGTKETAANGTSHPQIVKDDARQMQKRFSQDDGRQLVPIESTLPQRVHNKTTEEKEIDAENRSRISSMTTEEIMIAQKDLLERLGPEKMNMLKKLGQKRQKKLQQAGSSTSNLHDTVRVEAPDATSNIHDSLQITAQEKSGAVRDTSEQERSSQNTSWTEKVEAVKIMRFDLSGNLIGPDGGGESTPFQNVAERDFLRAEGDPAALGYTIKEGAALSRSTIPGQRAVALQMLAAVLSNAANGLCLDERGGNIDWQAIWAYALGPDPELALTFRLALDDTHVTAVISCARALQALLSCPQNNMYFTLHEAFWPGEPLWYTAPVFRKPATHADGLLGAGNWKYNVKPSELFAKENEDDNTVADDTTVASKDVAAGLLRMGILPRIRYILEVDKITQAEESLLLIIIAMVRHSPAGADAVMKCPRLIDTVIQRFLLQDDDAQLAAYGAAIQLIKVLSQASKAYCIEFAERGVLQAASSELFRESCHFIYCRKNPHDSRDSIVIEVLRLWRACIHHGVGIGLFPDFYSALCAWLSPSSEMNSEALMLSQESYSVLEVLARNLPILKSEQQGSETSWSWNNAITMVDNSVEWLEGARETATLGYVLHFLATVCERVSENNDWLPEFVPRIGLAFIKTKLFPGTIVLNLLNVREKGDTQALLEHTNCLRGAIRLASAVERLIRCKKRNVNLEDLSEEERVLHSGILLSAAKELMKLTVVVEDIEKVVRMPKETHNRGGPAPGVGVGWGALGSGIWSSKVLLAELYSSILLDLDTALRLPMKTKLEMCRLWAEPSVIGQALSEHILCNGTQSDFKERLVQHYTQVWLQRKTENKNKKEDEGLSTIHEDEEDEQTVERPVMRQRRGTRTPLPSHWILSPLHVCEETETVLAGLRLLIGLGGEQVGIPVTRIIHALSTVFLAEDIFLENAISDALWRLQDMYGSKEGQFDFEGVVDANYSVFAEKVAQQYASASYGDRNFGRQIAFYMRPDVGVSIQQAVWRTLAGAKVLNLLPSVEDCSGRLSQYLDPPQKNAQILEMYVSTWISGGLDRAFVRKSLPFRLAVHHVAHFMFDNDEKLPVLLRKKFARNIIRTSRRNATSKDMLLELLNYFGGESVESNKKLMKESCDGDASLQIEWQKLTEN